MRAALRSFRFHLLTALMIATGLPSDAQLVDDGFNPNVFGTVRCSTVLPDGKLWIGGEFTRVGSTTMNNLVRLRWNGSFDPSTPRPNPNGRVRCLLLSSDGSVLVGGDFTEIAGQPRLRLVRLLPNGSLDPEFHFEADGEVRCLLADGRSQGETTEDGSVLVGGAFTRVNGEPCSGIARIFSDGRLDESFRSHLAGTDPVTVNAMIRQADRKLLLAGRFDSVGGNSATNLARLHDGGIPDSGFAGSADGEVHALGVQADGRVVIGGDFAAASGSPAAKVARLNRDGSFGATLPGFSDRINTIAIQADGKIIVGGRFKAMGGQRYGNLARLGNDMTLDKMYEPQAGGEVFSCTLQSEGHLMAGGSFTSFDLMARRGLVRLNRSGKMDATFYAGASWNTEEGSRNGPIATVVQQPDEKLVMAGPFVGITGVSRNGLARTNLNGTAETGFLNSSPGGGLTGLQVRRDQKIFAFGSMATVGQVPRTGIARFQSGGLLDSTFNANVQGPAPMSVTALTDSLKEGIILGGAFNQLGQSTRSMIGSVSESGALNANFNPGADGVPTDFVKLPGDGVIIVSGNFRTLAGVNRPYLQKILSSGFPVSNFNPAPDGPVNGMLLLSDQKLLVWGGFTRIGGAARQGIARLWSSGSVDLGLNITTDGEIRGVQMQADGGMFLVGSFTKVNGLARRGLARLLPSGQLDSSVNLQFSDGYSIRSALVQQDGKLLFWGKFYGPGASGLLARLSAAVPAGQELGLRPGASRIFWQLSGSAPLPERVWFSWSSDGSVYTAAAEARRVEGFWESDDLKLPSHQPVWIRAEGRVPSTSGGDAGGLMESVRQIFLEGEIDVATNGQTRINGEGAPVDLGRHVQGNPPVWKTFTISNHGNTRLFLNQATVTPGFHVTHPTPSSLQPGNQFTLRVRADDSVAGNRPGELRIPSDDLDEPVFTVPLTAEVVNPLQAKILKIRTVKNRKTGLREQTIRVSNADGTVTVPGYRVIISGLPPGVEVSNASGILEDGSFYIDVLQPLGPLGSFDLLIEYTFPKRQRAKISPYLATQVIFVPEVPVSATAAAAADLGIPFVIDRIERMSDGSFLLEFRSVPGRLYQVEYSTDNLVWKTAIPTRAAGSRVQWIDRAANESDKGFYRVRELED